MPQEFAVDKAAVGIVVGLCLVVWPAVIGATLWQLGVLEPATMGGVEIGVALGTVFVGALAPVQVFRQLRGAIGVRISERGISARGEQIAWSDVTGIEEPSFGTLVIKAGAREITLETYLFRGRDQLEKFVQEQVAAVG